MLSGGIAGSSPVQQEQNLTFTASAVPDAKLITFTYLPNTAISETVTAAYELRKDNKTLFMDRKTFDSVSPKNPIQIAFPNGGQATYTMYMLIGDNNQHYIHKSIDVLVIGNTTSFSSGTFINSTNPGTPEGSQATTP
jgi:hypothetical protein